MLARCSTGKVAQTAFGYYILKTIRPCFFCVFFRAVAKMLNVFDRIGLNRLHPNYEDASQRAVRQKIACHVLKKAQNVPVSNSNVKKQCEKKEVKL